MPTNNVFRGVIYVALGATSYGMLATLVKLAYHDKGITGSGFTPAEVIGSQFLIGTVVILLLNLYFKLDTGRISLPANPKQRWQLLLAGTSTGLTSIFYYLAVKYIPVSIGIVLLMQTVWMGVIVEMILDKKIASNIKIFAVVIVLIGTALATNLVSQTVSLDYRGVILGILAAASFTTTMFTANKIAIGISAPQRSLYMLLGGGIIVFFFVIFTQNAPFNYDIFYKWGILLALFGTIIPPLLLNAGFPDTGIGLGSIVSSMELPVSVLMAYFLLNETVQLLQWCGIGLILFAIVMMNVNFRKATLVN